MQLPRVCDIEALIVRSPNAVIFLSRSLVGAFALQLKEVETLSNRTPWGITTYLTELVVLDRKRTSTRIAQRFVFSIMTSFGAWVNHLVTSHQLSDNAGPTFFYAST